MDRKELKEAREVAEEEITFAKETGSTLVGINRLTFYKRQLKLCNHIEAQEQRIEELEAELQKKSEFLQATAKTLFSERRSQEDTAIRWVLDKDGFVPPRRS